MGDYKLIEFYEDRRLELYDLRKDISEEYDLAAVKPGRVDTMRRALDGWRNSVEAKIPRVNPDWRVSG
jgi:hypothetical protein